MSQQDNITLEYLKSILDYEPDTGIFTWKVRKSKKIRIGDIAGCKCKNKNSYYIKIRIDGCTYSANRLAFFYVYGWLPDEVDHIDNNGPKTDNRICNLRAATKSQNRYNVGIRSDNTSGFKGVSFDNTAKKYRARIYIDGKETFLGNYHTPEEAAAAYAEASEKYHGEYGRLK